MCAVGGMGTWPAERKRIHHIKTVKCNVVTHVEMVSLPVEKNAEIAISLQQRSSTPDMMPSVSVIREQDAEENIWT
jgi:hypothetical protein